MPEDEVPLKHIQRGEGSCKHGETDACGGTEHGTCTVGNVCQCKEGYTGPQCLAHAGHNAIDWDAASKITDIGFIPPQAKPMVLIVALGVFVVGILLATLIGKERLDGWVGGGYTRLE
mmetsp:Transcript_13937/g.19527  ORF Transcript_13937/g.19527 Transcript_13937/m.19527 type:complete len:118 (-) Transcript_13937:292-645(-)